MYHAKVLADSVNPIGCRLITIEVTFPRFILAEVNTHRVFSRNSASSRAIPPEKIIEKVLDDPFVPETFNTRVKGMGVGEEVDPGKQISARDAWLLASGQAVAFAERLLQLDIDKSRINRLLEPFMWHTVIISSTEWDNFFALRDNPSAQPEFQKTARLMLEAMRASNPVHLAEGEWHMPLITDFDIAAYGARNREPMFLPMVSARRCARVSYDQHTEEESLKRSYGKAVELRDAGHLSPFEHVARPAGPNDPPEALLSNFGGGWVQLRKLVPHEGNRVGYIEQRPTWTAV